MNKMMNAITFSNKVMEQMGIVNSPVTIKRRVFKVFPKIERIIYSNPATIVFFADGDKVVVKAYNEPFDKEKGVAMAIARKLYSRSEFMRIVEGGVNQQEQILDRILKESARKDFEMNNEED